ncbi:DUF2020 domain-containing protein [Actinokineospora diospyrosa]|uniref:DUF2020 domain-containing protein n=1 Tax=Actinokineospora diospyrosa TaxID=103728 RepID=A0ABT1ICR7_9PSEU|nr:DUF2020 domain-containing protein [Actinokineospora diospyrosa]MCP2270422.1 protein of unknown function (DUF2020) [Actinokineospora diospyrosa]
MRRALIVAAPLLALAACATTEPQVQPPATTTPPSSAAPAPATKPGVPPAPEPVADGPCPYLESSVVADANGQHVTKVRTSADKPHPACFFYRPDGSVQLTARIYTGDPATAKLLVDEAAPVATSNPASTPAGWTGGSLSTPKGAIYAVAKSGTAVVVSTNQEQTIKARRITEAVITNLGL